MKRIIMSLIIILLIIGIWLWKNLSEVTVNKSLFAMGTFFEITTTGHDSKQAIADAFKEIKRIESLTSNLNQTSLASLNRSAGKKPVKVPREIIIILKKITELYPDLSGSFDPTIGPLVDLWGFNPKGRPNLPESNKIKGLLYLIGFDRVIFDEEKGTVFLPTKGMKLDFGGVAKGYAIDRAYLALQKSGISSALINGGSSSIRVIGKRANLSPWRLGIGHPRQTGNLLGTLGLPGDRALGTSADNQNYLFHNGKRYSHLINPKTGYPAQDKILVTVTAPTALEADLLSTAFFVLPIAAIKKFISANPEYGVIIYDSSGKLINLEEETFKVN